VIMSFLELKQNPEYGRADLLSNFPKLAAQYRGVIKESGVKRWLDYRPKTQK